jgi:hypothetical protein
MDDKRNNARDGDNRHHPIQRGDQPKPAHFVQIDLKKTTNYRPPEGLLIWVNGSAVVAGSISLRANAYEEGCAMHLHTYRDESRSWHLDLIGGRGHPWSIDLVVVIASGILLIGLACALAAHLIR